MALILPEIKHEYIFQLDTEETKNSVFDQCREEAKEAAYSTFGTNQNDAEYQPSPIKDPDYMMDYCTSDGHDYLKDYRLIWGYGIGIIEQDVICSLTTGEHLAEGTEACDTYEAENAAGENINWKRGIWLKFSGNRNVSPTCIGEVVLPEKIISLKDLCVALQLNNDCHFVFPITNFDDITNTTVLNTSNMCGQNNHIIIDINSEVSFNMTTLNCSYMFANATIGEDITDRLGFIESLTQAIDFNHCFYKTKFTNIFEHIDCSNVLPSANVESMFEESNFNNNVGTILYNGPVGKATFKNCTGVIDFTITFNLQSDVESAFEGTTIINTGSRDETNPEDDNLINWNSINFNKVTNAKKMFYNTTWNEDEVFLDLSSVVEHEDGCFDDFLYNITSGNIKFNIKTPDVKVRGWRLFKSIKYLNIVGNLYVYDYDDEKYFVSNDDYVESIIFPAIYKVTGTIIGTFLFNTILTNDSNVILKTKQFTEEEAKNIINYYINRPFPTIFSLLNFNGNINGVINLDDYYFVNAIITYFAPKVTIYNIEYNNININKINKKFCLIVANYINGYNSIINTNNDFYVTYCNNNNIVGKSGTRVDINNPCNIIINNETENNINIYPLVNVNFKYYNPTTVRYYIDAKKCIYNADFNNIKNSNIYFKYIDTIKITYKYKDVNGFINNHSQDCIFAENVNNIIINNLIGSNTSSIIQGNMLILYTSSDNINITSDTNIYNFNIISPLGILGYDFNIKKIKLIETPIYNHTNGNVDYISVVGLFNNTKLSNFAKRSYIYNYETGNSYRTVINNTPAVMYYNNVYEKVIDDLEDKTIYFIEDSNNHIQLFSFNLIGNFDNVSLNVEPEGSVRTNSYFINNYITTNDYLSLRELIINNIRMLTIQNMNGSNINIVSNNTVTLEITNSYIENINIDFNISYLYIDRFNLIVNTNIKNIFITKGSLIECYLAGLSALTEESINNIVRPSLYDSGATLTINTIPFQYITEEQKQALVNAGVTLIEYIPTETTE